MPSGPDTTPEPDDEGMTTMRTTWRVVTAVAAVAALALLGACGGDDSADETTTTAEATTTTLSDEDYTEVIEAFSAQIEGAGTELYALVEVQSAEIPPSAANAEQAEQLTALYAQMLRALGGAITDDPTTSEALVAAADQLEAEAEEEGYPLDFLEAETEEDAPEALTSDAYKAAVGVFTQRATDACAPSEADVSSTTTPADAPSTTAAP